MPPKSTIPKRSSPLAGPPITIDDNGEVATPTAKPKTAKMRPEATVFMVPKKKRTPTSSQGSQALMKGAQATTSLSPPSALPAAQASSTPSARPAPSPAQGPRPGENPVRNHGAAFTLLSTPPPSVQPQTPPPQTGPTIPPAKQLMAEPTIAAAFAPPTPPVAAGPFQAPAPAATNRGQKRPADGELQYVRTSPGRKAEADLFLLENHRTYSRGYIIQKYLDVALYRPDDWDILVGIFFTWSGDNPLDVLWGSIGTQTWERDWGRIDRLERNPDYLPVWRLPKRLAGEGLVQGMLVHSEMLECFKEAMRKVAKADNFGSESRLRSVLEMACWCPGAWGSPDWMILAELKTLPEGPYREAQLAKARSELPRFYERYYNDRSCGIQKITRPRPTPYDSELHPPTEAYNVSYDDKGRHEAYDHSHDQQYREALATEHASKKRMMAFGGGRPTQIHAVPYEERALDSRGRKLPWAHEWPEGHPNARGHRRQPEEKGPFGKSSVRKSSSRASRTATPAKKDNPALDGFEQAMKHDQKKQAAEAQQQSSTTRAQNDSTSIQRQPSHTKEPTQVILYGFSSSRQCDAIEKYEIISCGMICEDYARGPRPKIPMAFGSPASARRALTPAEKSLVSKFAGGNNWIKVTFDSAEAAERAIYHSPHQIGGHWVYAQEYRGVGPEYDEPILTRRDDQGPQLLGAPSRPSQTIGPSFGQKPNIDSRGTATLPRSFATNVMPQASEQESTGTASLSSSTASSATATGPNTSDLRNRRPSQTEENRSSITSQHNGQATTRPQGFTHFPDIPRTILRPASEAFLPHPTWSENMLQRLINAGWIPGDFIGNGAPRLGNGDFDYANASYYWIFCHWLDSKLGTDLCGLQDQ